MESDEKICRRDRPRVVFNRLFQRSTELLGKSNKSSQSTVNENSERVAKLTRHEEITSFSKNISQRPNQYNNKPSDRLDFQKSTNSNINYSRNKSFDRLENDHHSKKEGCTRKDVEKSSPEDEFVHSVDLDKKHKRKLEGSTITFKSYSYQNSEDEPVDRNISSKKELSKIAENKPTSEDQHLTSSFSNEASKSKTVSGIASEKNASNTRDSSQITENCSFNRWYSTDESSKKPVPSITDISLEAIKNKSKFTDPYLMPYIEAISKTQPASSTPDFSFPQEILLNGMCNSELSDSENKELLSSANEDFIPPPVSPEILNISGASKFESDIQRLSGSNSDNSHSDDESCSSLPDSDHLNAISDFIKEITAERKASVSSIDGVLRDLNGLFKDNFEGNLIDIYGSFAMDLAISTSNINLVIKSDVSIRKSFMLEVYKVLASELEGYHVHPMEEGFSAHDTKICFSDPKTNINCELTYLGKKRGESVTKMEKYLKTACDFDNRVRTLIIAAKIWAEYLSINEVEDGKLHPISFALLVIHFLQHCENPLLPISSSVEAVVIPPSKDMSIGELWMTFLRYYAVTFNWKRDVVTVDTKDIVTKKAKGWKNYWIAIEDPFSEKNIAATVVNCDIADYIAACFKYSYEYFCNPLENDFNEGSEVPSSPKLEFNFQQCVMGQDEAYCEACEELDDTCSECQKKLYVQPITPMPKMTDEFLHMIKRGLTTVYETYKLSDEEVKERKQFVKSLESTIQRVYPDAQVNLFGSTTNGFGFKKSDLDICISFQGNKANDPSAVLKIVRSLLRKDRDFVHIIAIFNATIPILKFHYTPKGWRGDISLNNTLAVHNSELLHTYSLIDERCKILGCALKLLAKKALVAEVTEKALSSYSYLIMVIHFLQQTEPPVLPVLQDNQYRKDYKLEHIVENCNIWFCKDLDYIQSVFKSENETPVEQLWLDLLDYYCSLDPSKFITIRQREMLHVNENQHSARLFNIQDPFIETKNLGIVVSVKKAEETRSVFNRARHLFRTPKKELPSCVKDIEDYFFSSMSLTGRIQKEAFCEMCGKFGHEQKECKQCYFLPPKYGRSRYSPTKKGNFKNGYQKHNNKQPMTRNFGHKFPPKTWNRNGQYPVNKPIPQ